MTMPIKTYQELFAWQKAMDLAEETYRITRDFPSEERFGLTSQLRRAAVSVPSNVAEGHQRGSTSDYVRYLHIAKGSLAEAETQIVLATRLKFLNGKAADPWLTTASEVGRLINGLIASLRGRR
jgi:four helix bundle protein